MKKDFFELIQVLINIKDPKIMEFFLKDLLTPGEIEDISERLQIVRMLLEGIPQRKIAKELKVSIAKVTRGSRELQYGNKGFKTVLKQKT